MNPAGGDGNNNAANIEAFLEGLQVLAPEEFDEFGIGPVLPRPDTDTQYLLSVVDESMWLHPRDYRYLITQGQMDVTYNLPLRPLPPALYMVPTALLPNILLDGYGWPAWRKDTHVIDDGPVVYSAYYYEDVTGLDRVYRRVYFVAGVNDVFLIHYKVRKLDRLTGQFY